MNKIEVLDKGYIELVSSMGNDQTIVDIAGISFGNDTTNIKVLKHLWDKKHTSPFEMVEFLFKVKAPLFVMRQWQRHRTWSYNELSRRYTDKDIEFYTPATDSTGYIRVFNDQSLRNYKALRAEGLSKENARLILPKTVYSTMYAKVDLRNLIHFLQLRNHPDAQWEIQEYARAIEQLIEPIVPETMKLYREEKDEG